MQTAETSSRPRIPLELTFFVTIVLMATLFALTKPLAMADLGVYLRMGAWMAEQKAFISLEPFTLAVAGAPFQNGTWGSQVLLYGVHQLGGYPAIQVLLASVVALTLLGTGLHVRAATSMRHMGLGTLLGFFAILQNLAIRPQTFSLLGFTATWYLLERRAQARWTPVLLFGIFALWANLHGAFPITFAIPAAFGLEQLLRSVSPLPGDQTLPASERTSWKRWALLGFCMLAGSCLNPEGLGLYLYILENSHMPASRGLDEWLAPKPLTFMGGRLYLGILALSWVGWKARRQVRLGELLLVGILGGLALGSVRMIVWFGLVACVVGLRWAWAWQNETPTQPPPPAPSAARLHTGLGAFMAALFLLLFAKSWPDSSALSAQGDYANLEADTPVEVATYLAQEPGGRTFSRFEWGSYFLWRLWPQTQPFLDIRLWQYDDALWQTYLDTSQARGDWQGVLEHWKLDTLVLSTETQQGLIDATRQHPGWRQTHRDAQAVVLRRVTLPSDPSDAQSFPASGTESSGTQMDAGIH